MQLMNALEKKVRKRRKLINIVKRMNVDGDGLMRLWRTQLWVAAVLFANMSALYFVASLFSENTVKFAN